MSSFYPHIAVLRGVAILLVVLFHMNPAWCPQGYFGVDLFLVISGYLLIGRYLRAEEPFALGRFVAGRVRRLLPPVLLACALAGGLAALLLPQGERGGVFSEVTAALTFRTNVVLEACTANYFAADTRAMPLMHLWYLAVLMQMYLVLALLFAGWSRLRCSLRVRVGSLAVLALLSLAVQSRWLLSVLGLAGEQYQVSVYYWTSARLWEPIVGGLLAVLPAPRAAGWWGRLAAYSALLLLLVVSFVPLPDSTRWIPLAVLLSLALVRYGAPLGWCGVWSRALLWVGGISFSLYLVHWPLISFAEYLFYDPLTWGRACVVGLLSVLLGWGCCVLGERWLSRVMPWWLLIGGWVLAACPGVVLMELPQVMRYVRSAGGAKIVRDAHGYHEVGHSLSPGEESTDSPLYRGTEGMQINLWGGKEPSYGILQHLGHAQAPARFVVLGDSHAQCLCKGIHSVGMERGWSGVYLNTYLMPFYGEDYHEKGHVDHTMTPRKYALIESWLAQHPDIETVIVVQYWVARMVPHRLWDGQQVSREACLEARTEQLRAFCRRMQRCGKQVVFMTPTPWLAVHNVGRLLKWSRRYVRLNPRAMDAARLTEQDYAVRAQPVIRMLEQLQREGSCHVVHAEAVFFPGGVFDCMQEGTLMMSDSNHLSDEGAVKCVQGMAEELDTYCRAQQPAPAQP
ncbi:MAG: acyltransferase family protein [Akkermansia sp.]